MSKVIITSTPPTPNGDLHVGHVSGPYLAADVHARFLRSQGKSVAYVSSSDDNQSYVVTTAKRLGVRPRQLAREQAERIRHTLAKASIAIDAFTVPDRRHVEFVQQFFLQLYEANILARKKKTAFWCREHGRYVFESYLKGYCRHCFSPTAGGICEACGHPNDASTILDPQCGVDPRHTLERREVETIVLELERFRSRIRRFYADKWRTWRPHALRLVDELLENELPDYPISYISDWGIPAPFPRLDGRVLNVWAEMFPGLMRTVEFVEARQHGNGSDGRKIWHPDSGNELIQFLGYDNSFFFFVVHLVLALARPNECILPTSIVTNEFYQLDNFKFSTSKNHAIWARDLLDRRPVDEVRFYLALSNPEHQKANFTETEMDKLVDARLAEPWQVLAAAMRRLDGDRIDGSSGDSAASNENRALAAETIASFRRHYAIETFSMQGAAELFSQLLVWLGQRAAAVADLSRNTRDYSEQTSAIWAIVRLMPALLFPLLPDFAQRLDLALGQDTRGRWPNGGTRVAARVMDIAPELEGVLARRSGHRHVAYCG